MPICSPPRAKRPHTLVGCLTAGGLRRERHPGECRHRERHRRRGEADKRGEGGDFTNDVKVDLVLPPGVTATPAAFTFQGMNNDQKVTLAVTGDAAVGTHVVKVNALPTAGQPTSAQFDVAVKSKS